MIDNYFESGILFQLTDIWIMFSEFVSTVYDILSTPLKDLLKFNIPVVDDVLQFFVNVLGVGNLSVLSFMFGSAFLLFVVVVITKFFIAIVPGGD